MLQVWDEAQGCYRQGGSSTERPGTEVMRTRCFANPPPPHPPPSTYPAFTPCLPASLSTRVPSGHWDTPPRPSYPTLLSKPPVVILSCPLCLSLPCATRWRALTASRCCCTRWATTAPGCCIMAPWPVQQPPWWDTSPGSLR
jgi:hypothetical protein